MEEKHKKYFASVRIRCNIGSELTYTTIHDNGKASCNSPSKPAKNSMKAILFQWCPCMRRNMSMFEGPPIVLQISVVLDEDEYGIFVELYWVENQVLWKKNPVPLPLCPLWISRGLARYRSRAFGVSGRRLTEPWQGTSEAADWQHSFQNVCYFLAEINHRFHYKSHRLMFNTEVTVCQ